MNKKCFLCGGKDSILDFETSTFENCSLKLSYRKHKNFKYHDVNLTSDIDSVGYHSSCYKKVTVLKKKLSDDFNVFIATKKAPENPDPAVPSASSTAEQQSVEPAEAIDSHESSPETPTPEVPCASSSAEKTSAEPENPDPAVPSASSTVHQQQPSHSSATALPSASFTRPQETTCIFCNRKQKSCGKKVVSVVFATEDCIRTMKATATSLQDSEILTKVGNQRIVPYHKTCYTTYLSKERRSSSEPSQTSWHRYMQLHRQAYESLSKFIEKEVIENSKVMYFSQLFSRYQALLLEFANNTIDPEEFADYRPETLEKKVLNHFGDLITIEASTGPRFKKIVYKTDIDVSVMVNNTKFLESKDENRFDNVAYDIRNCVKNIENRPLPSRLTADDVIRGQCDIPQLLSQFIRQLISGPDICAEDSDDTTLKVASICSDIIYAITKGRCKPAKHLTPRKVTRL